MPWSWAPGPPVRCHRGASAATSLEPRARAVSVASPARSGQRCSIFSDSAFSSATVLEVGCWFQPSCDVFCRRFVPDSALSWAAAFEMRQFRLDATVQSASTCDSLPPMRQFPRCCPGVMRQFPRRSNARFGPNRPFSTARRPVSTARRARLGGALRRPGRKTSTTVEKYPIFERPAAGRSRPRFWYK